MELPFTRDEFLDVFAAYNDLLWPAAVVLWLVSLGVTLTVLRRTGSLAMTALLAVHWLWSGIAYHLLFFSAINPAARVFAAGFVIQAGLIPAASALGHLQFEWVLSTRHALGIGVVGYSLAYPFLVIGLGEDFPRAPSFGVPCPTTLFTVGAFLMTRSRVPWWLAVLPVLWCVVGGSAALLLGIRPDLMLFLAGALLVIDTFGNFPKPGEA